jgi:hypothetical protein
MKIILTENQYKLLEAIINEAATPFSTKIEEGGFIEVIYLLNDIEKSIIFEITKKYGSGQYIEGTNNSGNYIINIGGSLDKDKNTFGVLKDGKYKEGGKDVNGKVIPPEVVGGINQTLKNVIQVNISDSNKNVIDKILTNLGEDKKSTDYEGDDEEQLKDIGLKGREVSKEERDKRRLKKILNMVNNDPNLRKLYHHQPSILGGLIKLGKAKGISYINTLLNKHNFGGEDTERVKKEFLKGQVYSYEVMIPVRITYGTETINLFTGQTYKVRFDGDKFNGHVGEGSEKISYFIKTNKKSNDNTYIGTVTAEFKQKGKDNSPDWTETKSERIVVKFRK